METWRAALRREVRRSARVAVLGVGHPSRGDDAAGTLVARRILAGRALPPERALVVAAGEAPESFTGVVRRFGPDLVVVVDAARGGRRPGRVFLFDERDIADEDLSSHRIPLSRLARYVRETMGCRVVLVGIEPAAVAPGPDGELTPAVGRAVAGLAGLLARALAVRSSSA